MKIGIELGWQAVRIVTIGDGMEILSVSDAGDSATVSTPPVVAQSPTGALVGRTAIDITGDESARRALSVVHPFTDPDAAPAADGEQGPGALSVLLEKAARDLRAFGCATTNVTFIISDEIVPRKPDPGALTAEQALPRRDAPQFVAFETAAKLAGFDSFHIAYRAEAAAIHGKSLLTPQQLTLAGAAPVFLNTIVVDVGLRAVRLTLVDLMLKQGTFEIRLVNPGMSVAATDLPSWIGEVPSGRELEFDLFGHFTRVVSDQIGDTLPPAGLNRLWSQVCDRNSPDIVTVIDSASRRQLFDVAACRDKLLSDVKGTVQMLVDDLAGLEPRHFVFLTGQMTSLEGIASAVAAGFGEPPAKRVFAMLPAHALASAAQFDPLPTMPSGTGGADAERRQKLKQLPINDGKLDPVGGQPAPVESKQAVATPIGPFDDIFESPPSLADLRGRRWDAVGEEIGSYWAVKVDTLLRLRATAPTVSLKNLYDRQLRENGIDEERDGDVRRFVSETAMKRILSEIGSKVSLDDNARFGLREGILKGFATDLPRDDAPPPAAGPHPSLFGDYVEKLRAATMPPETRLVVVEGKDGSAALPGTGLAVVGRAVLTTNAPGLGDTQGGKPERTLGYSSDGFRTLLASETRPAPRPGWNHFVKDLVGGASDVVHMGTILGLVALAGVVAALAWIGPRPAQAVPVGDVKLDFGSLNCTATAADGITAVVTNCTMTDPAPKLATTDLAKGCYVGVLRVVGPAPTDPVGPLPVSVMSTAAPPSTLAVQCLGQFKPLDTLNAIESTTAANVADFLPILSADGLSAKRDMIITRDGASMLQSDLVWVGYNAKDAEISLNNLWNLTFSGTNKPDQLQAAALCVDLGVRMSAVPLADPATAMEQVRAILDDSPAAGLQYLRLRFADSTIAPKPVAMVELSSLTRPTLVPYVDPNVAGEPALLPTIPKDLLKSADGKALERLIGSCPQNG